MSDFIFTGSSTPDYSYEAWHVAHPVFCTYRDLDTALEAVARHAGKGQHKVTGDVLQTHVLFKDGKVQRITVESNALDLFASYVIDRIVVVE